MLGGIFVFLSGCVASDQSIKTAINEVYESTTEQSDSTSEVSSGSTSDSSSEVSDSSNIEENSVMNNIRSYARDLNNATYVDYEFKNVSVHDPSVIKVEDTFYVFGSHLAAAKTTDLMNWELVAGQVRPDNPMFPNVDETLAETLSWAQTDTFWAPDVTRLPDGQFYFYYNACRGDSPLSAMGVAKAASIEGPYEDLGIILKSGMWGQTSQDGKVYDANVHPNVVDPQTFFDKDGNYWMVYGSYSGGIFIMKMDETTGLPIEGQGYGKKLLGGYHARIEGPYILYSPETEYYYLFLSFGGLDRNGGYNIRVARSKNPDGPYVDASGQDMIDAKGVNGKLFYDPAYEPYGLKLMGNSQFKKEKGEKGGITNGYVSPGHNSAYYNEATGQYFLFFHTRFPISGESHQVRVHQFFMNEEGWPVVVPYRYTGEIAAKVENETVTGAYKLIDHGHEISADMHYSTLIALKEDGQVIGETSTETAAESATETGAETATETETGAETAIGTWKLVDDNTLEMTIGGIDYSGVFVQAYDENNHIMTMTFTVSSKAGNSLWGSQLWIEK